MESSQSVQPIYAGEFRHAMDAKKRVTIPSRWRRSDDVLDEFFVIPNLKEGFLMVMPPAEFKRLADKVEHDSSLKPEERAKFMRQFSSRAQHVVGDKQGRIVIPDEQAKQLDLHGEVVLVGNYTRFEIWDPEKWQKSTEEDAPTFNYLMERIGI
jgi:MraZ protein